MGQAQLLGQMHYPRGRGLPLPAGTQRVRQGQYAGRRGWVYQNAQAHRWYFAADDGAGGWILYTFGSGGCPCGS